MHYLLPAQRARRGGAGPSNDPAGSIAMSVSARSLSLRTCCGGTGAGVIGTLSSPSSRHEGVPEERRTQWPSVSRSGRIPRWSLRGRRRAYRRVAVRLPLGQDPLAGLGPGARDGPDRLRVALLLVAARSEATAGPGRPARAMKAEGTRRFEEGPRAGAVDVPPELPTPQTGKRSTTVSAAPPRIPEKSSSKHTHFRRRYFCHLGSFREPVVIPLQED